MSAEQAILDELALSTRARADELDGLIAAHAGLVFRVAYSVLRNRADAEDAAQETFLRVWRGRAQLAEVQDVRAWLARIAFRVALDRRPRRPEHSMEELAEVVRQIRAAGASAEETASHSQTLALVGQIMDSLPRELREPLVLASSREMNSVEIAAVLGVPEATVRTRLHRARQLLRDKLAAVMKGHRGK